MAKKAATHRNKGRVTEFLRTMASGPNGPTDGAEEIARFEQFAAKYTKTGVRRHSKRRGPSDYNRFVSAEVARLKAQGVPAAKQRSRAIARWKKQAGR